MMRDWKQSEESYLCRRTVIVGLVGLASLGNGIIWLTRQCHSFPEPARGTLLFTYQGHSDTVNAIAWSPDGKRIASGSYDHTVQVWDTGDGSHIFTYKGHSDLVGAVAWSPDGKRIASGSWDGTVQVWNATDGIHVYTHKVHSAYINVVAWSPDGKRIASGPDNTTVQVWDATVTSRSACSLTPFLWSCEHRVTC